MGRTKKVAMESSSPPDPSPSDMLGETQIPRRLVRIARDQRDLLERNESWAHFLNRHPKGFLNVPPDVLKNMKECHARQLQAMQSDGSASSTEPRQDVVNQEEQHDSRSSQVVQPQPEPDVDDEDGNGSPTTSWASSSPSHKYPPQRADSEEDDEPQFITQLPPISSPQPSAPTPAKRQSIPPFPPSSQDQEEPLEVEVPTAINDRILAVNKPAVRTYTTPPSAQVVPCTFDQTEQSSMQSPEKVTTIRKQPIYKEVPEFYRSKNESASTFLRVGIRSRRPGPLSVHAQSSSSVDISSSIIPSTIPNEAPRKALPFWLVDQTFSPSKESPISRGELHTQKSPQTQHRSPEYKPPSPQLGSSPPALPVSQIWAPASTKLQSASQTPFIRYAATYTTYNGSITDFVTACMYIQDQQRRIRTSLYDDFIRAWHEGYVSYVRDCDDSKPPMKALNAIDWYNEIDDDPSFTSRIVTRQNLQSILNFYPDELRSARSHLGISPIQSPLVLGTPDVARPAKDSISGLAENAVPGNFDLNRSPDIPDPEVLKDSSNIISPATIPTLLRRDDKLLPLHKSMSEVERGPATARGLVRAFSEAAPRKRKASEDLGSVLPKKLSVNSLAGSDSVINASANSDVVKSRVEGSVASSSVGSKKNKYIKDPEKRSKDWRKFLKQRKQWDKDSITSSAPVNNTPTSAQRE
ncbi:hypothetical protein F4677DRAFT_411188 [Hypoxylon crocopeplum]|nr:hypothetical protein F4677DRAFT_411188 [Hypoxylon crocopeplum]